MFPRFHDPCGAPLQRPAIHLRSTLWAVLSSDGDHNEDATRSVRRLLTRDISTVSLLTVWATVVVSLAITAFAATPYWGGNAWLVTAAVIVGSSLLVSPLVVRKLRWLSHMSTDGALVEASRDGWGEYRTLLMKLTQIPSTTMPRYSYTYLGTVQHILSSTYFTREPPDRLRVLVDPDHPERAVVLGGFAEDPLPERIHIPAFSTHIGPWLGRLDPGVWGCGCSVLIFLIGLGMTGYGFGHASLPPGPERDAWMQIGLLSPVAGALYLFLRLGSRRR